MCAYSLYSKMYINMYIKMYVHEMVQFGIIEENQRSFVNKISFSLPK